MPEHRPTLANELRDGLLQDLLAASLLLEAARNSLVAGGEDAPDLVKTAADALHEDIERVRGLIARLREQAA